MKQAKIGSFFIKRSATASNDILPPSKKIKGDISPSPINNDKEKELKKQEIEKEKEKEKYENKKLEKLKEDEGEEEVATPPMPSSPEQEEEEEEQEEKEKEKEKEKSKRDKEKIKHQVKFDESGEDTEEDEDAQEHARRTLSRRSQSMPEHALKAAARMNNSSDEENNNNNRNNNNNNSGDERSTVKRKRSIDDFSPSKNNNNDNKVIKVDKSKSRLILEHQLGSQKLQIRQGDITEEYTGAIVNAANSSLAHGGGVAGAISRKGGPQIQSESDKWVRQNGTVPAGRVAVTGPGRLPCTNVIHAVGPVWTGGKRNEDKELFGAVWHSLLKAHQLGLPSIAIPAISSGIFGFPKDRCAYIMTECAVKFCTKYGDSPLQEIRFTNFDNETIRIFSTEFQNRFSDGSNSNSDNENEDNNDNENKNNNDSDDNNNNNNNNNSDDEDDDNYTTTKTVTSKHFKKNNSTTGEDTEEDEDMAQPTGYESDSD